MSTNNALKNWTPERVAATSRNTALILIGGIVLGIFATKADLYYVAAIVAATALVFLVSWQFEAALVVYALVAFMPWGQTPDLAVGGSGVGKGVFVSEAMLGFLLIVWVCKYLSSTLPKDRIKSGFYVPIALYLAYSVINVTNSYIFWDPHVSRIYQKTAVNVIEIGIRLLSAGAFIMFATTISNRKWLKWTTVFVMIPGLYNLVNALFGGKIPLAAPWWPLVALLPLGFCWSIALDSNITLGRRMLCAALVAIAIFVILFKSIAWVSGWLGLLATLGAITYIKSKKLFMVCALLGLLVVVIAWPFLQKNVVESSQEEGDYDRFSMMAGAIKYATNFPLGVGFGNYRTYNSFYYGHKWGTTTYTSAHGTYSQHLSEAGIPGLILFLAIPIAGFVWLYRNYKQMKHSDYSKTYLLAVLGQIAGIVVASSIGDYIMPTYHNGGLVMFSATVYSWIIWGLAVAHIRLYAQES